jgi:hypothetical protein
MKLTPFKNHGLTFHINRETGEFFVSLSTIAIILCMPSPTIRSWMNQNNIDLISAQVVRDQGIDRNEFVTENDFFQVMSGIITLKISEVEV